MSDVPPTMRAIGIDRFGGADELKLMQLDVPEPASDEVLVKVEIASVNPVDYKMRQNGRDAPYSFPVVLGRDMAGRVVSLGAWATSFKAGDRVFAFGRKPDFSRGTYAEYVALPVGWLALVPPAMAIGTAGAMPLVSITAYQALRTLGLSAGQTVLIHAGAGAVGSCAVQLAALIGARVITTATADTAAQCKEDGAQAVVDHRAEDFVAASLRFAPGGVDAVLDTVGGETMLRSAQALRNGGRLVTLLAAPPAEPFASRGIRAERVEAQGCGGDLAMLGSLATTGRLKIRVAGTLPLEQAAEAHRRLEAGAVRGKLLLRVADA